MVGEAGSEGQLRKDAECENECLSVAHKALPSMRVLICLNVSGSACDLLSIHFFIVIILYLLFCMCVEVPQCLCACIYVFVRVHMCVCVSVCIREQLVAVSSRLPCASRN
jgi:hypothetical protein